MSSSRAPLQEMCARLAELQRATIGFLAAVERGDMQALRRHLADSRGPRAALGSLDLSALSPEELPSDPDGLEMLAEARALSAAVAPGAAAIDYWLGRQLPDDLQLLASPDGVAQLTDAMLPAAWDYRLDLALVIGAGLDSIVAELVRQGQQRVVVYDPAGERAPAGAQLVTSLAELRAAVLAMGPNGPTRLVSKQHPHSPLDGEQHERAIGEALEAMAEARIQLNTINAFSRTWTSQALANLEHIADWPTVDALSDSFAGQPLVIVAPGPSLAKNVHLLRELRGKAILLTFSHTLSALAEAGVVPDLIMTVDPQDVRYHFEGIDLDGVAALVNGATVHPELFRLPARRFLTLAANSALDDWIYQGLGVDARIDAGGSVATSALALALSWKCDPIVLVGLDLSFPDGRYYVAGSCDGDTRIEADADGTARVSGWSEGYRNLALVGGAQSERLSGLVELPGYRGGTVQTSPIFRQFHRWFEQTAQSCAGSPRLINCTEGGARIQHTEQMPLREALGLIESRRVDVGQSIDRALDGLDRSARRRYVGRRRRAIGDAARRCLRLSKQCQRLARRAPRDPKALTELAGKERALRNALQPILFLSLSSQREIAQAMARAHWATTLDESLEASARLFATITDLSSWLAGLSDRSALSS